MRFNWIFRLFFFQQLLNVLTLGLLAAIVRNPSMMHELESGYEEYDRYSEALPTPLSKIDPPYAYRDHSLHYRMLFHWFFYLFSYPSSAHCDQFLVDFVK